MSYDDARFFGEIRLTHWACVPAHSSPSTRGPLAPGKSPALPRGARGCTAARCIRFATLTWRAACPRLGGVLARVLSASIAGVEATVVAVEVDVTSGLPSFATVDLPDSSVRESRDRVRAAIKNSATTSPRSGSPLTWPRPTCARWARPSTCPWPSASSPPLGSSSRTGSPGPWSWASCRSMAASGPSGACCRWPPRSARPSPALLVPAGNAAQAAVVDGVRVIPLATLNDAVAYLDGERDIAPASAPALPEDGGDAACGDFAEVRGQPHAKGSRDLGGGRAQRPELGTVTSREASCWWCRPARRDGAWRPGHRHRRSGFPFRNELRGYGEQARQYPPLEFTGALSETSN